MFVPWNKDLAWNAYRFVIVGSGPAGLFLADALAPRGKVLVIEAGSLEAQYGLGEGYYELTMGGREITSLGSRLSAFGGTSNHWGGHSHPLSPEIFANRDGLPGWPIGYEDYAVHLDAAARFCRVAPFSPAMPTGMETGVLAGYQHLEVERFHYSNPMLKLGDPQSVAAFGSRTDIHILMETRLVDINLDSDGDLVATVALLHRPSRETVTVPVEQLILATGGIENARNLLWAGRKYPVGNPLGGGPNALTGTHYTEHIYFGPVEIFIDARADMADSFPFLPSAVHPAWTLSAAFRALHRLPRFGVFPDGGQLVAIEDPDLAAHAPHYVDHPAGYRKLDPEFQFEQTPHKGSFVTLGDATDADGIANCVVHWNILEQDFADFRRATILFCSVLNQKGRAISRLRHDYQAEDWSPLEFAGSNHHMGTTRMGDSPRDGVVDRNCQVFGVDNLFVAGSSVFPTGDYVNPTMNIVAMAARLADFIAATQWIRLRFGSGQPDVAALVSGWSYLEGDGVWSEGNTARLEIAHAGVSQLILAGRGYREVKGAVSINGVEMYRGKLDKAIGIPFHFPPADRASVVFEITDPAAPADFGENEETRKLGIFLSGLEVR